MIALAARRLRLAWSFLRTMAGDDAYDRYLHHQQACHTHRPFMDRKAFYLHRQHEKWSGMSRCC